MVDSVQSAKFITQKEARTITEKIKQFADVYNRPSLERTAYVGERIRNMDESVVSNTDLIFEAISSDNQLSFKYAHYSPSREKKYSKKGDPYIVSPYALYWDNGNYYLYAYLADKDRFQYFRIDRMEKITLPLQLKREGKEKYKSEPFTKSRKAKTFSIFSGEEQIVKIRFLNILADTVIDEFGKDIILVPVDDNHFETTQLIRVNPQFFSWIAMFGKRAQIISPPEVVKEMKEFSEKVYSMYHKY